MKICSKCKLAKPFDRFHNDKRRSDGKFPQCKDCTALDDKARRIERHGECLERDRKYYANNKDKRRAYIDARRDTIREQLKQYRATNRDELNARNLANQKANPELYAAHAAAYRARKLLATPKWANRAKMLEIYRLAKRLEALHGVPYHVDHIVPLVSDIVCGLHWEGNLQLLPESQNVAKGNRYWPDMP